ncbi:site-specific integrase [Chitinophaga sp. LS1]|uniref:site-specific integrase n=1 Tax=Chitinophaga sp. LS1 TaxID=3051176 RepID=UPI002AAA7D2A|nr:site-specific integrase [Chitinophaga sp. LS1]WPV67054.1 site-specific integrase [Chitinophaga sp. LS1]
MRKIRTTFDQLIFDAGEVLLNKLLRTRNTVIWYRVYWRRMYRQLLAQGISEFTSAVGRQYLVNQFGELDYATLSKRDKDLMKIINVLCEFYDTGTLVSYKERIVLDGPIGQLVNQFVAHLVSLRLKPSTINERKHYLSRFCISLNEKGLISMDQLDKFVILDYLKTLDVRRPTVAHMTLRAIKTFLRYLFEQGILKTDTSLSVPKDNYKKQAKLPSVFKTDEIQQMIGSIDRSNACGKRNYAIVLLAARLGLRASDIAGMRFENLHWEQSTILFNQYKTGRELQLPLLAEVGEAIIDYLKYGRPVSEEPYVFLLARSPFGRIHSSSVTNLVNTAFVASGVNIMHRHYGPHALRHSLAGLLLEQSTVLPVITEVLGHESSCSTKYYLRVDLNSMKQCMLDVPAVPNDFYSQKGGYFYA